MAFSSAVTKVLNLAPGWRLSHGTWTNGASTDTGGVIATGLKFVRHTSVSCDSHIGTQQPKVTKSAGNVTILTSAGGTGTAPTGTWIAYGL
jgi:hypothetical protein